MLDRCKRGHPWNEANTRYARRHDNPLKTFRMCRACAAENVKRRYRCDDAFREQIKSKNLNRYYERLRKGDQHA